MPDDTRRYFDNALFLANETLAWDTDDERFHRSARALARVVKRRAEEEAADEDPEPLSAGRAKYIRDVFMTPGPAPHIHWQEMARLRDHWPDLFKAIIINLSIEDISVLNEKIRDL